MKENEFKDFLTKIDSDASMDQRISEQLINYDTAAESNDQLKHTIKLSASNLNHKVYYKLSKIAAAIIIFAVIGSTTALAASYFLKSYPAEYEIIAVPDITSLPDWEITHYGAGHKNESTTYYDPEGIVTAYYGPEDPNKDDVKSGDDVFAVLGLPNLVPTYLYDNFFLGEGGYHYIEQQMEDGTVSVEIAGDFFTVGSSRHVYFYYFPSEKSLKDTTLYISNSVLIKDGYETSTYTTAGGLLCNIVEYEYVDNIDVTILFDSEVLGNAYYTLSFIDIPMEEAKKILESIPITIAEE